MNARPGTERSPRLTDREGRDYQVRPAVPEDLDALHDFFRALPEEDRNRLRFDVADRNVVEERIRGEQEWGRIERLVILEGDRLVATGVLELREEEPGEAEVRLIVARDRQKLGLGSLLARELYFLALREGVESIRFSYLASNAGAREIARRLGFRQEEIREGAGRDRRGRQVDLVVARCPIQEIFEELEHYIHDFDWRRSR